MIQNIFPGKLYLMGEYNVMEANHQAVIMAIDRTMTFSIEESDDYSINSSYGNFKGSSIKAFKTLSHVYAAASIAQSYLEFKGIKVKPYHIEIKSNLDDGKQKFGFGSSGVSVVGVLKSILDLHGCGITQDALFKLSVLVQYQMSALSSGGDLASTIYGGVILYTRYDELWLLANINKGFELLDILWPYLNIEPLDFSYQVMVGWTQSPFVSQNGTQKLADYRYNNSIGYHEYLDKANRYVYDFVSALKQNQSIESSVHNYQTWLEKLGEILNLEVITPVLSQLIEDSKTEGLCAKVSGAGGGDCGIAFIRCKNDEIKDNIISKWLKHGILYIETKVWNHK